jgi:mRNA interferase MazF
MVKILKNKYDPKYVPRRGDIVWVDCNPVVGHEQGGRRPAIVLSARLYNLRSSLAVICPITSQSKNYPFEVLCVNEMVSGYVLSDQIKSIDWKNRKLIYIAKTQENVIKNIIDNLKMILEG